MARFARLPKFLIPHSPLPFPRSAPAQRTSFFLRGRRFFLLVGAAPAARKRSRAFADFTCSRRRFLFLKKRAIPVAVPAFFGARSARLKNPTAATRSPSFLRHRRRRSLSLFSDARFDRNRSRSKAFYRMARLARPPYFFTLTSSLFTALFPCGRRSLSLFSDSRFARKRSRSKPFYSLARFARLP